MSFLGCAAWCHTHKPDSARRPEVLPRSRHYLADTVSRRRNAALGR